MTSWGLILIAVLVAIFVLVLLREVYCWYAKTNRILRTVEQILERLPQPAEASQEEPDSAVS